MPRNLEEAETYLEILLILNKNKQSANKYIYTHAQIVFSRLKRTFFFLPLVLGTIYKNV